MQQANASSEKRQNSGGMKKKAISSKRRGKDEIEAATGCANNNYKQTTQPTR
jgi:hypothetical protein